MTLRAVEAGDAGLLADGFARLSTESRYRRFLTPVRTLSARQLDLLTTTDHDHGAVCAVVDDDGAERGVGVARFVRSERRSDHADVALTVVDEWHGRGLGRVLLRRLAEQAVATGVHHFTADVLAVNTPMLRLLRDLGHSTTVGGGSEVSVTVDLVPHSARPAVTTAGHG